MYMVRCSRSSQTSETKAIIKSAKKNIDNGMNWKDAIKQAEAITDTVQREKAIKAIIEYV